MNWDSDFFKILAAITHFAELVALVFIPLYGIINKSKSVSGFVISRFLAYLLKGILILIPLLISFFLTRIIYFGLVLVLAGNLNDTNCYWNNDYWWAYIIPYLVWVISFSILAWICSTVIWTGSLNYTKILVNNILPKDKRLKLKSYKTLNILSAKYGANNSFIDVTSKAKAMVQNNSLTITASNSLAGDPIVGIEKKLIIEYQFDSEPVQTLELNEHSNSTGTIEHTVLSV
jgi:hypothetical protein